MSTSKNNNIYTKTSFLSSNSSEFIEQLYKDYAEDPSSVPSEWSEFFSGLKDQKDKILKTIDGPSWSPNRTKKIIPSNGNIISDKVSKPEENTNTLQSLSSSAKESVRANMLVRAYRIRGHLISELDPLGLLKRNEHPELKPETYGFSNKDLNKKIFLDGVLGIQTGSLKEILSIAKKTYCKNIGFEFMHMSDPEERKWIRDRIE